MQTSLKNLNSNETTSTSWSSNATIQRNSNWNWNSSSNLTATNPKNWNSNCSATNPKSSSLNLNSTNSNLTTSQCHKILLPRVHSKPAAQGICNPGSHWHLQGIPSLFRGIPRIVSICIRSKHRFRTPAAIAQYFAETACE